MPHFSSVVWRVLPANSYQLVNYSCFIIPASSFLSNFQTYSVLARFSFNNHFAFSLLPFSDMFLLQIVLFLISKFLITISYNIIYIYSAEMFPTELRLSLCGFASMFGRIGSMIAPQTVLLVRLRHPAVRPKYHVF